MTPAVREWARRIGWFVAIWALSVVGLFIVAAALRQLLTAAGLHT